ncbi:hypothetical protein T265_03891 [Opisthorchis viverrini]|uniref:PPM-type phosphatase domain-containing protein n=1 Tax=Opisthorchis viverrini TaxID=6198 RepID=A0A074ZUJ4_OPIVI|nr:hypothetical protein T265_03891 [Opisthorchis viverrini]KER29517.1 hypothetical protein T265_03891 [Opisthorchis viverrini]
MATQMCCTIKMKVLTRNTKLKASTVFDKRMIGGARAILFGLRPVSSIATRGLCYPLTEDHAHSLTFLGRHTGRKQLERLLSAGAIEILFDKYINSGLLSSACPIKRVYVNQLAANSPIEDRWNIGLTQVDGVVSSCLFTVLDGHSGTACVHTLAWAILDYIAAAFLDTAKLHAAIDYWRTHAAEQPYHLARRLDLLSSTDHRHLGHAARSPSTHLCAHMRGCLKEYVTDLVDRTDRNMDPVHCFTEAFLRLDDDLCSTNRPIDFSVELGAHLPSSDSMYNRELMRVALSGAVGVAGRIFWDNDQKNGTLPTQLHIASVGDCGAVLLRQTNDMDSPNPELEAIACAPVHQGWCNEKELKRVEMEHPDNSLSELFREGGRLLGELAPSRAFGNVRYKWPANRLLELSSALNQSSAKRTSDIGRGLQPPKEMSILPNPYTSPPYLTAQPDVTSFEITPRDRYLVLATDGLWDMLSSGDASEVMEHELRKPTSPATRLIWNCLVSVPPEIAGAISQASWNKRAEQQDVDKLPLKENDRKAFDRALKLLSLPPGVARYYRDDITVMVIELFERPTSASVETPSHT